MYYKVLPTLIPTYIVLDYQSFLIIIIIGLNYNYINNYDNYIANGFSDALVVLNDIYIIRYIQGIGWYMVGRQVGVWPAFTLPYLMGAKLCLKKWINLGIR